MNFESLPRELMTKARWCFTGSRNDENEAMHKTPHALVDGMFYKIDVTSDHNKLLTWSQMCELRETYPDRDIGWVLTEGDGLTCIDLDVKDDTPVHITQRNANLIKTLDTYTEISRSGNGYHVWITGEVKGAIKTSDFEVYSKERFIICTGQVVLDRPMLNDPELIASFDEQVDDRQHVFNIEDEAQVKSDEQVIQEVNDGDHTGKFSALMTGNWEQYQSIMASQGNFLGFDPSQADAAFMTIVTYYTGNFEQCKRLWRMSALADVTRRYPNDPAEQRRKARNLGTEYKLNRCIVHGKEKNAVDAAMREQAVADAEKNVSKLIQQAAQVANADKMEKVGDIEYPPGKLGELAEYFYNKSFKQIKLFGIAEAIAVASALFGRVYNVSNTGLNNYLMVLAPSGTGKSDLSRNPDFIFNLLERDRKIMGARKFIMTQRFTHENAMLKEFQERTSFTQCLSEFGKIFKNMMQEKAGPNATVREQMTDIYSKSGAFDSVGGLRYTNQDNVVNINHSVAYSFLGESVSEPFFENVSGDVLTDGFMSRFLVLEYDGAIPYDHDTGASYPPAHLMTHLEQATVGVLRALSDPQNVQVMNVRFSVDAEQWVKSYRNHCTDKANENRHDPIYCSLWTRANLKSMKLAALCAVMDKPWDPQIELEHLHWAESVVNSHNALIMNALRSGRLGSVNNEQGIETVHQIMVDFFSKDDNALKNLRVNNASKYQEKFCVPNEYIMRTAGRRATFKSGNGFKKPRDIIRETLREMEDAGLIQKLSQKETMELFKSTAVIYRLLR